MTDQVTAPDMEVVIMEALSGTSDCDKDDYRAQARAVLAAITAAGEVEWGTDIGTSNVMHWRDRAQAERQSASSTKSYDGGKTWAHTNPPVVSRLTFPWTAVEG